MPSDETIVTTGLPCSIQARREGVNSPTALPGGATQPLWYVFIPAGAAPLGTIQNLDIVIDDLGNRHQVIQDYWDSLGYRLSVIRLQA